MNSKHTQTRRPGSRQRARGILVPLLARRAIKDLRERSLQLTIPECCERLKNVSVTTWRALESEEEEQLTKQFDLSILNRVASLFGMSWDQVVIECTTSCYQEKIRNFKSLEEFFLKADIKISPVIKDDFDKDLSIEDTCNILVKGSLQEIGLTPEMLFEKFRQLSWQNQIKGTLPPPSLEIHISDDLEELKYRFGKKEIVIYEPSKLLDFTGSLTCVHPSRELLRNEEIRSELLARFYNDSVSVNFMKCNVRMRCSKVLWPPSIDAFWMLFDLKQFGFLKGYFRTVSDIGSGTGILGNVFGVNNHLVSTIHFSEFLLSAILYSQVNYLLNKSRMRCEECKFYIGINSSCIPQDVLPFDLCLCNPPYLPLLLQINEIKHYSAVAGTDLLQHIILNANPIARKVLIQFGDIAIPEARQAADKAGVRLKPIGEGHWVPFSVGIALAYPEYIEALIGRGIQQCRIPGHDYAHHIQLYEISGK